MIIIDYNKFNIRNIFLVFFLTLFNVSSIEPFFPINFYHNFFNDFYKNNSVHKKLKCSYK